MNTVLTSHPPTASAPRRGGFSRNPALLSSLLVILTVALSNAVFVSGVRSPDPVLYRSGLGPPPSPGSPTGYFTIDPNDGWTTQALGHLAATTWARGHVPLWNSYEGLGQPLAGEMQSAALFQPFIMLQLLPNGVFVMHLVLEILAGLTTVYFLRHLRLGWVASCAGGCLFAINGAFAVMTNAPFNPIAFLPMGLLGIEMIRARVLTHRRPWAGVAVLALAIAWMLLAGFPETAFLEGAFICCWVLMRLVTQHVRRGAFSAWSTGGILLGLALACPLLVAFADFLSWGSTSYHEGTANDASYSLRQITSLALPFATGALDNPVMNLQAGYLTLPVLMMTLVGLTSARHRAIRLLLVLTIITLTGNMFGFNPIKVILNHVPGIKAVLVYKYGLSILEFAVIVAAAIGLDDVSTHRVKRSRTVTCGLLAALYASASVIYLFADGYVDDLVWTAVVIGILVLACTALALILACGAAPGIAGHHPSAESARRQGPAITAGTLLVVVAGWHFTIPQMDARPPAALDATPVTFLQDHLGTSRFLTLGPIQPNYGSYWGIAQLNVNDLPVPRKYGDLVRRSLRPDDAGMTPRELVDSFKDYQLIPFDPLPQTQRALLRAYGQKQGVFREAGVRYLVTRPGVVSSESAQSMGLHEVHSSVRTDIFEDPSARPYYTTGSPCDIQHESRTQITVTCPTSTTLTRRELDAPGWTAEIDGRKQPVPVVGQQLYQRIHLPRGTSHVIFAYSPRYFTEATACAGVAALTLIGVLCASGIEQREMRRSRGTISLAPTREQP